jgi:hypothetical protein
MDNNTSVKEFEILGYKVKLREEENTSSISASEVVDLVKRESDKIMVKAPHLSNGEVALLVALQMAKENVEINTKFQCDLDVLKDKAGQALNLIEEVSPTTL